MHGLDVTIRASEEGENAVGAVRKAHRGSKQQAAPEGRGGFSETDEGGHAGRRPLILSQSFL